MASTLLLDEVSGLAKKMESSEPEFFKDLREFEACPECTRKLLIILRNLVVDIQKKYPTMTLNELEWIVKGIAKSSLIEKMLDSFAV